MTNQLSDRLAAELAACERATEGPWEVHVERYSSEVCDYYHGAHIPGVAEMHITQHEGEYPPFEDIEDAEFIATARTALPTALRALQAVMERHRPVGENWRRGPVCITCKGSHYGHAQYPCDTRKAVEEVYGDAGN